MYVIRDELKPYSVKMYCTVKFCILMKRVGSSYKDIGMIINLHTVSSSNGISISPAVRRGRILSVSVLYSTKFSPG